MYTLCVIPTFNEAQTITRVIDGVLRHAPDADMLVVDDGSPDGTADLVEAMTADEPRIHLLRRTAKNGLGAAYRAGFDWGLQRGYDLFVEMDADLSHDPAELPALLAATATADVVIGSRYTAGGRTVGWSRFASSSPGPATPTYNGCSGSRCRTRPPGTASSGDTSSRTSRSAS